MMILVASSEGDSLSKLASALAAYDDVNLLRAEAINEALDLASEKSLDLVIADETLGDTKGLELAGELVSITPMVTCAVVSSLTPEQFHRASEGLGIMAQLPPRPGREHAESLVHRRQIKDLTTGRI